MVAFLKNMFNSCKNGCNTVNFVVFGKSGCIRTKWWYSSKSGGIQAKVLVSGHSGCTRVKMGCNWAKMLDLSRVFMFGQR